MSASAARSPLEPSHPRNVDEQRNALLRALPAGGCELEVAILFADMRDSTALAERLTPTAFSQLLQRFYAVATTVVVGFGGTIDKLVGDGVVALFVPGLAGADYARHAIDAAHALLAAMDRDAAGNPWPPIGIGVHVGRVWLGLVPGPQSRGDLTALGDPVNVTSHLCAAAGPGQVAISEQAFRAAGRSHPVRARAVQVKRRRATIRVRFCTPSAEPPGQSCFCALDGDSKSFRYSPYPSSSSFSTGMKRSAAELMQ